MPGDSSSDMNCGNRINVGLILLSEDWRVVGMNDYVVSLIPPAAGIMGENFFRYHPQAKREKVRGIVRELSSARDGRPNTAIFYLLGRVLMIGMSRLAMLSTDDAASLALTFMDVTEQTGAFLNPRSGLVELQKLPICENGSFHFLSAEEVYAIEADGNYCRIFTPRKNFYLLMSLKGVLERFPAAGFLRVHKSFIVNLSHVRTVSADARNGLSVAFDHPAIPPVPVSRRQAQNLKKALSRPFVTPE